MRIISGKYKNRVIPSVKGANYRPTTTKIREALFSILNSGQFADGKIFDNKKFLDIFSGTGSVGLEALSRGAGKVTFVDNAQEHINAIKKFAAMVGIEDDIYTVNATAPYLPVAPWQHDVVFLDPPYGKQLLEVTLAALAKQNWLAPGAVLALEVEKKADITLAENFTLQFERLYSNNKILIIKYE